MIHCPHCQREIDRLQNMQAKGLLAIGENVRIEIRRADSGKLLDEQTIHNMVTDSGLQFIRDLIDETQQGCTHFGIGTDLTPTLATHTALGAEVYRNSISAREKVDFEITQRCFLAPSAANGNTLYEAGLFNASSGGSLFSRVVHDAISKTISITVTYAWTHTIGRA